MNTVYFDFSRPIEYVKQPIKKPNIKLLLCSVCDNLILKEDKRIKKTKNNKSIIKDNEQQSNNSK